MLSSLPSLPAPPRADSRACKPASLDLAPKTPAHAATGLPPDGARSGGQDDAGPELTEAVEPARPARAIRSKALPEWIGRLVI